MTKEITELTIEEFRNKIKDYFGRDSFGNCGYGIDIIPVDYGYIVQVSDYNFSNVKLLNLYIVTKTLNTSLLDRTIQDIEEFEDNFIIIITELYEQIRKKLQNYYL